MIHLNMHPLRSQLKHERSNVKNLARLKFEQEKRKSLALSALKEIKTVRQYNPTIIIDEFETHIAGIVDSVFEAIHNENLNDRISTSTNSEILHIRSK